MTNKIPPSWNATNGLINLSLSPSPFSLCLWNLQIDADTQTFGCVYAEYIFFKFVIANRATLRQHAVVPRLLNIQTRETEHNRQTERQEQSGAVERRGENGGSKGFPWKGESDVEAVESSREVEEVAFRHLTIYKAENAFSLSLSLFSLVSVVGTWRTNAYRRS